VSLDTIGYAFPFEPFWTLLALFLSIVFVSGTAVYSGWHIRRSA
jgi:predicted lysophospholipase L1 biosynthesis ABC-type transport system permease subunit